MTDEWFCRVCGADAPDYRGATQHRGVVALPCGHEQPYDNNPRYVLRGLGFRHAAAPPAEHEAHPKCDFCADGGRMVVTNNGGRVVVDGVDIEGGLCVRCHHLGRHLPAAPPTPEAPHG